jgi:hypothetical protein
VRIDRSLGSLLVALGLAALGATGASAQPVPAGVTACTFGAISKDPDPAGLNVRDAPDPNARVLGHLLPPTDIGGATVAAEVKVLGYRKGWFLVDAGPYPDALKFYVDRLPPGRPKPYSGRGWVAGAMLTAPGLLRAKLKQAPSGQSADVVDLWVRDKDGIPLTDPQHVKIRRIIACSGEWVQVEIELAKAMKPLRDSAAPKGAARGWANGTCTEQFTTCDFGPDTPWSPPAPLPPE